MSALNKKILNVALALFLMGGALLMNGSGEVKADNDQVYRNIEIFTEVLRQIEDNYVELEAPQELIHGAIKGMVQSLDPHSSYMTKDEYKELMFETKGSFSGIGIEITVKDGVLTVVSPIEDTPAYQAGLKAGDKIIKIENKMTKEMDLMDAVKTIRGAKGTKVNLTIMREGSPEALEFSIMRDVIPLKSVRFHSLPSEVGYVRISNFQSKTAEDLASALMELEKNQMPKGLILDLRNNPGGLLSQAIEVSDLFLDGGVIVTTKGRDSAQNVTASAHKIKVPRSYPIVVLVNSGSASASEIVAGALQDNQRAVILGTRTFGKGSVQTILPLSDGSGLRLTTARYYTPSGRSIQSSGIMPDIELDLTPPPDKDQKDSQKTVREEDLDRHMPAEVPEDEKEKAKPKSEQDERVQDLLEKDNQVRYALELLRSWTVFSKMKSHS
jgi:carboxyl-terminal processing protease